jgi:hypothetical protein
MFFLNVPLHFEHVVSVVLSLEMTVEFINLVSAALTDFLSGCAYDRPE